MNLAPTHLGPPSSVRPAALLSYLWGSSAPAPEAAEPAPEPEPEAEPAAKTWKESAGRMEGRDSYVFGDITRGVAIKVFGSRKEQVEAEADAEAEGDENWTKVQRLMRDAVLLFRARGYEGYITMSYSVLYFTESINVRVTAPSSGLAPWEQEGGKDAHAEAPAGLGASGAAGRAFDTLLARLSHRAANWDPATKGMGDIDPMLGANASIGFAVPVIKLGWGVSVSLSISHSSLLRGSEREAALVAAAAEEEAAPAPAK